MKTLILTMGLPRSGKSTWAKTQPYPVVNPDSIRLSLHGQAFAPKAEPFVWAIARVMVESLFMAGSDIIILDATNTRYELRAAWKSKEWTCKFKYFDTSEEECIRRAEAGGNLELINVIKCMNRNFEPLYDFEEVYL